MEPIVFIVDDDISFLQALYRTIMSAGRHAEMYASGAAFLEAYDVDQPGCVVLDLRMPEMSGLTVQEQLIARGAAIPVIFVTAFGEVAIAVQAMQAGAVDFLQKPFGNQQLLTSIEQAIARDAQTRQIQARQVALEVRLAHLTPRERQVLDLVVAGYPNHEIATQLNIQPRTVEIHRHQIMQKMQVRSAVNLVRLLLSNENQEEP